MRMVNRKGEREGRKSGCRNQRRHEESRNLDHNGKVTSNVSREKYVEE
jgi:hypothetical protein